MIDYRITHWFLIFLLCVRTKKSAKQMTWLKNSLGRYKICKTVIVMDRLTEFKFRFWNFSLSKWDKHLKKIPNVCKMGNILCIYLFGSQNRSQIRNRFSMLIVCPYTKFSNLIFSQSFSYQHYLELQNQRPKHKY